MEPSVVAYVACLNDVQKSWDEQAPGASITEAMDARAVANVSKFLLSVLERKDDPSLATATMQILMELAFKAQRELVEGEQAEHLEKCEMLKRGESMVESVVDPVG